MDKLVAEAELIDSRCELRHMNHEGVEDHTPKKPVDFICQQFTDFEASIPICQECLERLHSDDWILLFCLGCMMSIWIHKPSSNRKYHYPKGEHIKWMNECPHCYKKE